MAYLAFGYFLCIGILGVETKGWFKKFQSDIFMNSWTMYMCTCIHTDTSWDFHFGKQYYGVMNLENIGLTIGVALGGTTPYKITGPPQEDTPTCRVMKSSTYINIGHFHSCRCAR